MSEDEYLESLPEEAKAELFAILMEWREAGNPDPRIYSEVDISGDGLVDYFTLSEEGKLILMPGADVDQSDYDLDGVNIVEELDGVGE